MSDLCVCGHPRDQHDDKRAVENSSAYQFGCQGDPPDGKSACSCARFLSQSDFPPSAFDPCEFCGKIAPFGGCCKESVDFYSREADAAPVCPDQDCISNTHLRGDGGRMKCDPNTHKGRRVLSDADAGADRFLKALFPERVK